MFAWLLYACVDFRYTSPFASRSRETVCFPRAGCVSCCRGSKPGAELARAEASGPQMCDWPNRPVPPSGSEPASLGAAACARAPPSPGSTALPSCGAVEGPPLGPGERAARRAQPHRVATPRPSSIPGLELRSRPCDPHGCSRTLLLLPHRVARSCSPWRSGI